MTRQRRSFTGPRLAGKVPSKGRVLLPNMQLENPNQIPMHVDAPMSSTLINIDAHEELQVSNDLVIDYQNQNNSSDDEEDVPRPVFSPLTPPHQSSSVSKGCECGKKDKKPMLECSVCKARVHARCVDIDPKKDLYPEEVWFCSKCALEQEYEVERILSVDCSEPERVYFVCLKGFKRAEYIKEADMASCAAMVQIFLEAQGIPHSGHLPIIEDPDELLVGALDDEQTNINNWVQVKHLKPMLEAHFGSKGYKKVYIGVSNYKTQPDQDAIYFVPIDTHIYSCLYMHNKNTVYIADGENGIFQEREQWMMQMIFRSIKIVGLKFNQQAHYDHCASSAIAIAGELWRMYNANQILDFIHVDKSRLEAIKSVLHKQRSTTKGAHTSIEEHCKYTCKYCAKKFTLKKKVNFVQHQLKCSLRQSEN